MASRGLVFPARLAIECYQRQTHADRELIVVSASTGGELEAYVAGLADPSIRYLRAATEMPVGLLRNQAIREATGDFIAVWDDDDLSHPMRLQWQAQALASSGARACVVAQVLLWWPLRRRLAAGARRIWENSLLVGRANMPLYPDQRRGSDTVVANVLRAEGAMCLVEGLGVYVYAVNGRNLWDDEHFEMLFSRGSEFGKEAYGRWMSKLEEFMPIGAYQEGLAPAG
jgi:glycosyltransferase involved in cell wall biosynthesis